MASERGQQFYYEQWNVDRVELKEMKSSFELITKTHLG